MGKTSTQVVHSEKDPLWYKTALIYEVPVRAFYDSNGDGIGDFRGLTEKLDYIQDLGATAIWLLPFYPSPLKDDGYDIADYYSINPIYGTLADFKVFLREAHRRGLRVITELVLNHTSDQHAWFQRARRANPGSRERDFYVWSDTPDKYKSARIIFKDFEHSNWSWDPVAGAYFWHRFYSHQPDLNYDSPHVQRAMKKVFEFWFDLGVDGFRLDAVPYLYEREGTSCENLPETHDYLKKLRQHLDQKYGDRMLLAEANQWPEDAVTYFGSGRGDECHMAFHFPLMPRLFMALRMEDRVPIVDILEQTPPVPETGQWALFLRNHDELTLEMVTDEERDYMYRVYASHSKARLNLGIRRRLAPLLNNDRKRIELLNMLLLSLPGTPVLYYGDEIGMGDNIFLGDRNGVRTPMQWSADKNAGFSRCSPQALYAPIILDPEYHYEAVNVETQQRNPHALLWWTKRVLALRKRWKVFGLGTFQFLHPANRKVLAYIRRHENEKVLVLANLSRFPQPVELDLSAFQGERLIELFGRTKFPVIGPGPYTFTLSPHAAFWFSIEPVRDAVELTTPARTTLAVDGDWNEILAPHMRANLEAALPAYIAAQRWFATRTSIKSARIIADVAMPVDSDKVALAIIVTELVEHEPEQYLVPIAFASGPAAAEIELHSPGAVIARLHSGEAGEGILYDATASPAFWEALLELLGRRRTIRGDEGELESLPAAGPRPGRDEGGEPVRLRNDDRNASMSFGERFIIKLLRKVEPGVHPELEAARFLAARAFPHVPPFAGVLEYKSESGDSTCLALLSQFIPNAKNGWTFTLDALKRYFDRIRTLPEETLAALPLGGSLLDRTQTELPEALADLLGTYYESVQLLGRRTAELHLVLASDPDNKDFAPEPFTPFYQRSLYQSFRNHLLQQLPVLHRQLKTLPEEARALGERVIAAQSAILARYRAVHETSLSAMRIRCHGDFHLNQVLHTGKDFVVIDFEGEAFRPMSERRIKRSPLRDVAQMMRSFSYAAHAALLQQLEGGTLQVEQFRAMEPWVRFWLRWISAAYLRSYMAALGDSSLVPHARHELGILLQALLLDQAVSEMGFELHARVDWVHVPLRGILQLLEPGTF